MSNFFRFMWGLPQFTFPSRTELSGRPLRCLDHDVDAQRPWHIFFVAEVSRVNGPMFLGWITGIYPLVNKHRPWQIEVGRLVSIKNGWFSGSMLIYWRVIVYFVSFWNMCLELIFFKTQLPCKISELPPFTGLPTSQMQASKINTPKTEHITCWKTYW